MSNKVGKRVWNLKRWLQWPNRHTAEVAAAAAAVDDDFDFGDVPPVPEEFWNHAVRGEFGRHANTMTAVREARKS